MKLSEMPNIGKTLEGRLIEAGIKDSEQLKRIGSKDAFILLRNMDSGTCLNTLYALEGAIRGIRWHYLSDDIKENLRKFYDSFK